MCIRDRLDPKVLNAVAAGNAPLAYRPPPDTGLTILHVDDDLLIVDKPAGLLSVPGRGPERHDSLATRVQQRYPGALIVHRLDMGTSGLLVMARNAVIHSALSRLFATRQVDKRYVAVAAGQLPAGEMAIDLPLLADWPNPVSYTHLCGYKRQFPGRLVRHEALLAVSVGDGFEGAFLSVRGAGLKGHHPALALSLIHI